MIIEEKRRKFLEQIEKFERFYWHFIKYRGPGLIRRIQRLIYAPQIYLPLVFRRTLFKIKKEVNFKTFGGRNITLPTFIELLDYFPYPFLPNEFLFTKFLIKHLKSEDIFYDIGASYGFYTYLALEFCKEVHSFEPLPDVFKYLKLNLENESKIFLNNVALSDKNGKIVIGYGITTTISTIVSDIIEKHKQNFLNKQIEVSTVTLDDYIKTHKPPTIIKLDVEGAESLVIEGGKEFLKNSNPIIAMEVWTGEDGETFSSRAVNKLYEFGYQSYRINRNGDLTPYKIERYTFAGFISTENFIFIK